METLLRIASREADMLSGSCLCIDDDLAALRAGFEARPPREELTLRLTT